MLDGNIINQLYMTEFNSPIELHEHLGYKCESVQYTPVSLLPFWRYPPTKTKFVQRITSYRRSPTIHSAETLRSQVKSSARPTNNQPPINQLSINQPPINQPPINLPPTNINITVQTAPVEISEDSDSDYGHRSRRRRHKERRQHYDEYDEVEEEDYDSDEEYYEENYEDEKKSSTCNLL